MQEKRKAAKHQEYLNNVTSHRDRFVEFHYKVRITCSVPAVADELAHIHYGTSMSYSFGLNVVHWRSAFG